MASPPEIVTPEIVTSTSAPSTPLISKMLLPHPWGWDGSMIVLPSPAPDDRERLQRDVRRGVLDQQRRRGRAVEA